MKKNYILSILALLLAGFMLCSMTGAPSAQVLRGRIDKRGSAPHVSSVFITEDNMAYRMELAPKAKCSLDKVLSYQGRVLELTGYVEEAPDFITGTKGTIYIESFNLSKKNSKKH